MSISYRRILSLHNTDVVNVYLVLSDKAIRVSRYSLSDIEAGKCSSCVQCTFNARSKAVKEKKANETSKGKRKRKGDDEAGDDDEDENEVTDNEGEAVDDEGMDDDDGEDERSKFKQRKAKAVSGHKAVNSSATKATKGNKTGHAGYGKGKAIARGLEPKFVPLEVDQENETSGDEGRDFDMEMMALMEDEEGSM
jgi:hypothetical protein